VPLTSTEKENLRVYGVDKGGRMNILERRARKLKDATPPIMEVYRLLHRQWTLMNVKLKDGQL